MVIVKTAEHGSYYGALDSEGTDTMKTLTNARQIHYYHGALTLNELASNGSKDPKLCRVKAPVAKIDLMSNMGFELYDVSETAQKSFDEMPNWEQK